MQILPFVIGGDDLLVLAGPSAPSNLAVGCPVFTVAIVDGIPITPVAAFATGGSSPYSFAASGLPSGLAMDAAGIISGTPTVSGVAGYIITVVDAVGAEAQTSCSITVLPPPLLAICLAVDLIEGQPLTPVTMIVAGGVPPYTFAATGLPPGILLSSAGVFSGTPSEAGSFTYTVTIDDSGGHELSLSCDMTVASALPPPPTPQSDPQVTLSFSLDGGNTFSPEYSRSLGKTGEFQARLVWNNLGIGRDAVIDIFGSDPVRIVLTGANFDAEILNH